MKNRVQRLPAPNADSRWARSLLFVQVPYYESSAKDNTNVDVVFETLASSIKRRLDAKVAEDEKKASETLQLTAEKAPAKKKGCC